MQFRKKPVVIDAVQLFNWPTRNSKSKSKTF
jgi:hypothetical protein